MADLRTTITEVVTGLGMLGYDDVEAALVAAPEALTMKQFCSALGRAMGRPSWAPVPGLVLKLLLGEMSGMLLTGQRAVPRRLEQNGYLFKYPQAGAALRPLFTASS